MKKPIIDINKQKEIVENSYTNLVNFINKFNPRDLLATIMLTFGISGLDEESIKKFYASPWLAWTEAIAGIVLQNNVAGDKLLCPSYEDLKRINNLISNFWKNIGIYESVLMLNNPLLSKEQQDIIFRSKIRSMNVRRDTYTFEYWDSAIELYRSHKQWFENNLGFDIEDAIVIEKYIFNHINKVIKIFSQKINNPEKDTVLKGAYELLSFTIENVSIETGINIERCKSFFDRMSLTSDSLKLNYPESFKDPFKIPWEFNPLYERPIIKFQDRYLVVSPSLMAESTFKTFYYDIMADKKYAGKFSNERGKWLEQKTLNVLQNIFPTDELFLNPQKINSEELCDILILHDHKIIIINCKAKQLTFKARIGEDIKALKEDFVKGIVNSFEQSKKAKKYIKSTKKFIYKNTLVYVDTDQVTDFFMLSVASDNYNNFLTQLNLIEQVFQIFKGKELPLSVTIHDLKVISEILDKPYTFLHYLKKRFFLGHLNSLIFGDEIDLLGYYLENNLIFNDSNADMYYISGFSGKIDSYILSKYYGLPTHKPAQNWPKNFDRLIYQIDKLDIDYRTECILKLLEMDNDTKKLILKALCEFDYKPFRSTKPCIFDILFKESFGISVYILPNAALIENEYKNIQFNSLLRKYTCKKDEWICIVRKVSSKNMVDTIFYARFKWKEDPIMKKLCRKHLSKKFLDKCDSE